MNKKALGMKVGLYLEFKAPKLVKVKAYKRLYKGKVVKVRSHYRALWDVK